MNQLKTIPLYITILVSLASHSPTLFCMDLTHQLFRAVRDENVETTKALLELQVDPNQFNSRGNTPLFIALYNRCLQDLLLTLLEGGANPNLKTKKGYPPLALAAYYCDDNIELLLEYGANPLAQDAGGSTALHYAVATKMKARPWAIVSLLSHGARPSIKNKNNETPYHLACRIERQPEQQILNAFSLSNQDIKRLVCVAKSLTLAHNGCIPREIVNIIMQKDFTHFIAEKLGKFLNTAAEHVARIEKPDILRASLAKNSAFEMKIQSTPLSEDTYAQEEVKAALAAFPLIL